MWFFPPLGVASRYVLSFRPPAENNEKYFYICLMPTGYKIIEQDKLHFLTLQVVYWIDIFTRRVYRDIIVENLKYCQEHKGLEIYAWVIMSNHVHLLVQSNTSDLSGTIRDFKSYTSKKILDKIEDCNESRREWMLERFKKAALNHKRNSEFQFWTHENHAEFIYSNDFIEQKIRYIHNNPVVAGIVEKAEEYLYSSAINYADGNGLLKIKKAVLRWQTYS